MEVQIVSKKLITPSSNHEDHPPNITLSCLDQLSPPIYFSIIFYYAAAHNPQNRNINLKGCPSLQILEKSLADTLTVFYPLAGRFNDDSTSIKCNDNGVDYSEARVNAQLTNLLLQQPVDAKFLSRFAPPPPIHHSTATPLLFIQVTVFECGGFAIGLRVSHLVADMHSISLFIRGWASACASQSPPPIAPSFNVSSILPPRDMPPGVKIFNPPRGGPSQDVVTTRFVFGCEALSRLKASIGKGASRVQVVTALIWRTLAKIDEAKRGYSRPSMATHIFNPRGKMTNLPIISESSFGNLWWPVVARFEDTESIDYMVGVVRDAIESMKLSAEGVVDDGDVVLIAKDGWKEMNEYYKHVYYICDVSSWCRMQHYQVDFGWGKPSWVSSEHVPFDGFVIFLDAKDGEGVEAWLSLYKDTMVLFEQHPDIVAFTAQPPDNAEELKKD